MTERRKGRYRYIGKLQREAARKYDNIEAQQTYVHAQMAKLKPGSEGWKEVISYASRRVVGDYLRSNRMRPRCLEDGEGQDTVREVDRRFTPQPHTAEETAEHLYGMAEKVFEFRLKDDRSIWEATKEKLQIEIDMRGRQMKGVVHRYNFLVAVEERLEPGQNPRQAGLTDKDMWELYLGACTNSQLIPVTELAQRNELREVIELSRQNELQRAIELCSQNELGMLSELYNENELPDANELNQGNELDTRNEMRSLNELTGVIELEGKNELKPQNEL